MGLVTVSEQWLHGVLDDFMEAKHQTVIWTNQRVIGFSGMSAWCEDADI